MISQFRRNDTSNALEGYTRNEYGPPGSLSRRLKRDLLKWLSRMRDSRSRCSINFSLSSRRSKAPSIKLKHLTEGLKPKGQIGKLTTNKSSADNPALTRSISTFQPIRVRT